MPNLRQLFLAHVAQTSDFPLGIEVASSDGMYLYDRKGKAYLDIIAGIGVSSLGHRHPRVVEAAKYQIDQYLHTIVYGEFVLAPQVQLASLIAANLPDPLASVYFVNSGTEATEGAMKLAKRFTGRYEFLAARNAYHGSSQGAASLMQPTEFTQAFHPLLPGIKHIDFNDDNCLSQITNKTAAVILETVQAESGLYKPRKAWLQAVRKRCTEVGALLVLDEIQAGYGRTGTLWAFEQYDVVPDILLIAKGMGGGMPIGAFVAAKEVMHTLANDPVLGHITTFGGHPVSTAAGLATLQTLLEEDFIAQVPTKERLFLELLQHPKIIDVRSAGLWLAVELASFEEIQTVIKYCLEAGLITDWFLFNDRSLRIAPPLIISENEIKKACAIILEGLNQLK